jgi:hypothetical protein
MPNEFVARNGIIALNNSIITGSLNVTQGVTASLFGTASWASNSLTSSNIQGGAANYIPLWNTATSLSSSVMYQSASNIGIGTASPNQKLEVAGIGRFTGTSAFSIGGDAGNARIQYDSTNTVFRGLTAGDSYAAFGVRALSIGAVYAGTAAPTSGMIVEGNVGIGTASPVNELEIFGSSQPRLAIRTAESILESLELGFQFGTGANSSTNTLGLIRAVPTQVDPNPLIADLAFSTNAGDSNTEKVRITGVGNVGIGTTTPNAKLDVNGNAIITGSLTVTSTITAQTLVVQTVTSSVSFITGSTRFGSTLSNTHQFTGSVGVTGSLTVNSNVLSVGGTNVGVGTIAPQTRLHAGGSTTTEISVGTTTYGGSNNQALASIQSDQSSGTSGGILYLKTNPWNNSSGLGVYSPITRMTVNELGNVGVGLTNPTTRLHVSASTGGVLEVDGADTAGANALYVSASGNVGIGTASPAAKLNIAYSGNPTTATPHILLTTGGTVKQAAITAESNTVSGLVFSVGDGTLVDRMTILRSNGNVGIGVTTPQNKLDVNGGAPGIISSFGSQIANTQIVGLSFGYIEPTNTNYRKSALVFERTDGHGQGSNASGKIHVLLNNNSNTSATAVTDAVLTIDSVGGTVGSARVGIGTRFPTASLHISGSVASDNLIRIQSSAGAEYFFISASGNIGIGTITPTRALHIARTAAIGPSINLQTTDSTSNGSIAFSNSTNTALAQIGSNLNVSDGNGGLEFLTNGTNTRMFISSSGNVGIGTTSPNARLDVNGNTIITGSLTVAPTAGNVELQVTSTGTKIGNVITDLNTITGSLGISGSTVIVGSLAIGTSSLGSTENTLVVGPSPSGGTGEGGQILLQATGGTYTSASMLDNYQNRFRILRGTNASSNAEYFSISLHTGQLGLSQYTGTGAFPGTAVANLAVDSSGNVITVATGGGGGSVTINNNTDNYLITATGTANTLNGEANLQFNGSALTITGSLTVITGSSVELQVTNTGVKIGNLASDAHNVTGSLAINGDLTVNGNLSGAEPIPAGAKLYLFYNY